MFLLPIFETCFSILIDCVKSYRHRLMHVIISLFEIVMFHDYWKSASIYHQNWSDKSTAHSQDVVMIFSSNFIFSFISPFLQFYLFHFGSNGLSLVRVLRKVLNISLFEQKSDVDFNFQLSISKNSTKYEVLSNSRPYLNFVQFECHIRSLW